MRSPRVCLGRARLGRALHLRTGLAVIARAALFALVGLALAASGVAAQEDPSSADRATTQAEREDAAAEARSAESDDSLSMEEEEPEEASEDVVGSLGDAMGELGESLGPGRAGGSRVRWDPSWPRYRFDELVVTLGMGLVIGLEELLPTRTDPNWSGTTDFDLAIAHGLGVQDPFARDVFEELSSAITGLLFLWPVGLDSLLYAGLGEGAWDVAWQLSLISLEVFVVNHALGVLVRLLSRRERPLGTFCRSEVGYDSDPLCRDQPPAESFWSSHSANAFAGAALVCLHHDVVDLFGDEVADGVACASAVALAATSGLFRILSDQNWATDVLTGAVVGTLSGLLIPWILHFQGGARPPLSGSEAPMITFLPMMGEDVIGLTAAGVM